MKSTADLVLAVNTSSRNPWFNMVQFKGDGEVKRVLDDMIITRRQNAPECFDLTTIAYVARPNYILKADHMWEGVVVGVKVRAEHSIDIDNHFDYAIAKYTYEEYLPSLKRQEYGRNTTNVFGQ